jgi:hypothetical protein
MTHANLYFQLTEELNAHGRIAVLTAGQAVVFYRLAMMSKDGDWVLRETPEACRRVLEILTRHGARYRSGAPLDVRWLAGGWSSHFELTDSEGRRIRCDFLTRPPRLTEEDCESLFVGPTESTGLAVIGVEPLIRMKQTQRAKDYPVIGELARLLPPEREIELTTDPDRILELAPDHGAGSERPAVRKARAGAGRLPVVLALAEEIDEQQQQDRVRLERYARASRSYLRELRTLDPALPEAHPRLCALAERLLPMRVNDEDENEVTTHADAQ